MAKQAEGKKKTGGKNKFSTLLGIKTARSHSLLGSPSSTHLSSIGSPSSTNLSSIGSPSSTNLSSISSISSSPTNSTHPSSISTNSSSSTHPSPARSVSSSPRNPAKPVLRRAAAAATLSALLLLSAACGNGNNNNNSSNGGAASPAPTGEATAAPSGSPAPAAKDVKLEFWTISLQPKFNDFFNKLIDQYEQAHPGVTVDWKDYPYDAIQAKLLATAGGKNSPDVVNLNTEFASQLASKGALADLNPLLSDEVKTSFFDGIYNSTVFDGKAYALPWYTGTQVLYMNTNLVKKAGLDPANPPKTKEELYDWAKQIKAKTGASGYATQFGANILPSEGVPILDEARQSAAFNSDAGIAVVEQLKKLVDEGVIVKDDAKFDKQIQYYSSEQVAFELSGPSFINFLKTSNPDLYKNTIAVALPTGKADLRYSNSMNLVVPKGSKDAQAAADFAAFVTNADNQTAFSKDSNTLPATKTSIQDPFFSESDNTLESQAKIASAQSLDKAQEYYLGIPAAGDINTAVSKELQNIILNGGDVKKGLDAAAAKVNEAIKAPAK